MANLKKGDRINLHMKGYPILQKDYPDTENVIGTFIREDKHSWFVVLDGMTTQMWFSKIDYDIRKISSNRIFLTNKKGK